MADTKVVVRCTNIFKTSGTEEIRAAFNRKWAALINARESAAVYAHPAPQGDAPQADAGT